MTQTENSTPSAPGPSTRRGLNFDLTEETTFSRDGELFREQLKDFVPEGTFDAHCHVYRMRDLYPNLLSEELPHETSDSIEKVFELQARWMDGKTPRVGLFFPAPLMGMNQEAANQLIVGEVAKHPECRGLLLASPEAGRAAVERWFDAPGIAGFKTYHVFAPGGGNTFHRPTEDWTPEWVWEESARRGWVIMLHLVLPEALAARENQRYLLDRCRRYPGAKVVLAHAARGFNYRHTLRGIAALRGLDNVWFDTSAITEPEAFEAILDHFGPGRLLYGSDHPVSEMRGRPVTLGEGFYWLYQKKVEPSWTLGESVPVGIESLLALRTACERMSLTRNDVERIFRVSAHEMLGLPIDGFWSDTQAQYREAKKIIPGGTQLLSKRPEMFAPEVWPAYYEEARGCEVVDTQGRRLVDMSTGGILSCILGYADPDVNEAVLRRVRMGSMSSLQTYDEVELAQELTGIHTWATKARFTRSGGESVAVAVRIARAATGRDHVAICGYHGWHDWYLAANLDGKALDGHLLPGLEPKGVPSQLAGTVSAFRYNRIEELHAIIDREGEQLAAIVMEPSRSHDPEPGFLEAVRTAANRCGAVLIFDEITIGWRLCLGGYHMALKVEPDIAVFAKAISNGYPMGAVIGRDEVMDAAAECFISSTFWTEGIGPSAALATIRKLKSLDVPSHLHHIGHLVSEGWKKLGKEHELPIRIVGRPQMLVLGFDHSQANAMITHITAQMLKRGFLAGGTFNAMWSHQKWHVDSYLNALDDVFRNLREMLAAGSFCGPERHTGFRRLAD